MRLVIAAITVLLSSTLANAQRWTDFPDPPVDLGYGWNSALGQKTEAICIDKFVTHNPPTQRIPVAGIGEVTQKDQLMTGLDISLEGQAQFVNGGGSSKTTFAASRQIDSETYAAIVYAKVENLAHYVGAQPPADATLALTIASRNAALAALPAVVPPPLLTQVVGTAVTQSSSEVRLQKDYSDMLHGDPQKFLRVCGDSFVDAINDGAELVGSLTYDDLTVQEKYQLHNVTKGNAYFFSGSSDIEGTLTRLNSIKTGKLLYAASGGWGAPIPVNKDELVSAIHNLPELAKDHAYPTKIHILPYSMLSNGPNSGIFGPTSALDKLIRRYWRLSTLQDQFIYVDGHRDKYIFSWGPDVTGFEAAFKRLQLTLNKLVTRVQTCFTKQDSQRCTMNADEDILAYEFSVHLPVQKSSFPAAVELETSAANAQQAVADMNTERTVHMKVPVGFGREEPIACDTYQGNHYFTQWSESYWITNVWPRITRLENVAGAFPSAFKSEMAQQRIDVPWASYCQYTQDPECVSLDVRHEYESQIKTVPHPVVTNGSDNATNPATACGFTDAAKATLDFTLY